LRSTFLRYPHLRHTQLAVRNLEVLGSIYQLLVLQILLLAPEISLLNGGNI
jgi:hypothetical protein